jgi:cytochrome c556
MKRILLGCILLSSLAFSEMKSDPAKVITMRGFESAMGKIQTGFLRNNASMVKLGTSNLKQNLRSIDSFMIESDDKDFNPHVYAHNEATAIDGLADEILKKFQEGKNDESRAAFDKVLSRCLACHRIIRKW